jgi:tRNA/tmRNA/rRNA uracil-C5-methylase (TrmA/RlmC/RlmD family)
MPSCPHFGRCGGCAYLDVEYPDQVDVKHDHLRKMFDRDLEFVPSPDVIHYRNRMDFSIGPHGAGLFEKGNWRRSVDLQSCLLMSPEAVPILRAAREEMERMELPPYDRVRHTGFVRYLVLREGKATGDRIASLVTSDAEFDPTPLCEKLLADHPLTGVTWQISAGKADLSRGEIRRTWGSDRFRERFDDVEVLILPNAFLQPNTRAATILYRDLRERVPKGANLLDLYCGVGTIGKVVREKCSKVTGVDNDAENIEAARSQSDTIEFRLEDARKVDLGEFDVLVVDPPRAGLHPKLARRLGREGPDLILYVSCNVDSFKRDLEAMGYRMEELKGYDFAPHTRHIEALAVLTKPPKAAGA